jgi:hypothetical protein
VIESVPFTIVGVAVRVTVAVVEESVTVASTVHVTFGSEVEQLMFGVTPLPTTKFVPVTPMVNAPPAVRLPTDVTELIVGPARIAIVPAYVSRPSVNEIGTDAVAAVPGATLIVVVMFVPVSLVIGPKVTAEFVEEPVQSAGAEPSVAWLSVRLIVAPLAPAPTAFEAPKGATPARAGLAFAVAN